MLLSEGGETKYRLTLHTARPAKAPPPVAYWARLTAYQPTPLTRTQAQALHTIIAASADGCCAPSSAPLKDRRDCRVPPSSLPGEASFVA